jgi:DNA-directed RNA polymerase specialized sigma24 family protein
MPYRDDSTSSTLLGQLAVSPPDEAAWSQFVDRYGPRIFQWCRAWELQEADILDVSQAVLTKLSVRLRHFDYDPSRSFRGWLRALVRSNELIEQVRRAEVVRLGKLVPDVDGELETIIHKAIAPEPDRRYVTAGALADDLRRFLEDRPIRARRASISERFLRWSRRNPWAAAFLLALGTGLVASTWEALRAAAAERASHRAEIQARSERDQADVARRRATAAEIDARHAEARARDERDRAEQPGQAGAALGRFT